MSYISACALFYGDHTSLADRCLASLLTAEGGRDKIHDFRLGLNSVCEETRKYVHQWARRVSDSWDIPCLVFDAPGNALKYPLMRKMFFSSEYPLAQMTMWFDDDSYLAGNPQFWQDVYDKMQDCAMVGQRWYKAVSGPQKEWLKTQEWSRRQAPDKNIQFFTGGWWTILSSVLRQYNWPIPELRHKGGDMLLGWLMSVNGWKVSTFDKGVRINADANGKHSAAERRGLSADRGPEQDLARNYSGVPLPTDHHDFEVLEDHWYAREMS